MGTNAYAPYSPQIQGDSWVPIAEEPFSLTPTQEQGYWFNLSASSTVITARLYVGDDVDPGVASSSPIVGIYPETGWDTFGPIQQVIIPANTIVPRQGTTSTVTPFNASTAIQGIGSANSSGGVIITDPVNTDIGSDTTFAVSSFATQLSGKRILKVEMLYLARWSDLGTINSNGTYSVNSFVSPTSPGVAYSTSTLGQEYNISTTQPAAVEILLGTPFFSTATSATTSGDRYPWNYTSLARFDPAITSAAQLLRIGLQLSSTVTVVPLDRIFLYYQALRITYCNETRVGIGGRSAGYLTPQFGVGPIGTAFSVPILDPTYTSAPTLTPGNYFVTATDCNTAQGLPVRAMRQLYEQQNPGIRGVLLPHDTTTPHNTLVGEATDQIPAISLHTSSAVVDDSHGYGQALYAPVYTGVAARQTVLNSAVSASLEYPLARFYARRLGETSSPLGLRNQANTAIYTEISVSDFDALDEIADGWRQVDLTFTGTKPTFSASGTSTYEWVSSAPSGARWEVLGARATNVTGLTFTEVGPTQWLAPTTYGGSSAVATWDQGSGTPTIDFRGDLTLMFARMPQVTGLSVTQNLLEVDVTDECDQAPGGIPTGVYYNTLSWPGYTAGVVGDQFERTVSSGWGTATSGQAWTVQDGAAAAFNVSISSGEGVGHIAAASAGTAYAITNPTQFLNSDQKVLATVPQLAVSNTIDVYLLSRVGVVNTNMYAARFAFNTDSTVSMRLEKWVAGVNSAVGSLTAQPGLTYAAGSQIWVRAQVFGSIIQLKAWKDGEDEPDVWGYVTTDTSLTAAGANGIRTVVNTGNTFPATLGFNDYTNQWGFGSFELQRMDQWTDWQTIMLATSPLIATFNDFEARVGVQSSYRIRACQELDFCGDWSATVNTTIPTPGVTGTNVSSSLLIFTSNARQDGSDTLAYSEIYDGTPAQTFAFLEAAGITMQPMYLRDYQVAYHGTERGGESFSRVILTNNAAVSLQNFEQGWQQLRDLAWDSVPYVCVRDQQGSRWLANVTVPNATSQPPNSSLQFASVSITEVTATAYPVDPS